jgi:hypothetical protein
MIKFNFALAATLLGIVAIGATSADAQGRKVHTSPEAAMAPPTQSLGGPVRQGNYCWISTDQRGFGYWRTCTAGYESFASAVQPPHQTQPQPIPDGFDAYAAAREAAANSYPGGGDGGGSGGGGGGDSGGAGPL